MIGDEAFISSKVALENFGSEFVVEILEKEDKIESQKLPLAFLCQMYLLCI